MPSWKYPRNLESPRVSSPGFGNDSGAVVISFLANNRCGEHSIGHSPRPALFSLPGKDQISKADSCDRRFTAHWSIPAPVGLSDACLRFTATHRRLRLTLGRE
ncbi:hypothetical protein TNCV_1841611 [Trichonephila clavipes]|nr:hypothetical protein TNCV_1841611 [Trichonephila clavipes]